MTTQRWRTKLVAADISIRMDEWLAELSRLSEASVDGLSMEEIAAGMGCSTKTASQRVRALMRAGRARLSGHRRSVSVSGRSCVTPVYKLEGRGTP